MSVLEAAYEFPHTDWSVAVIYDKVVKQLINAGYSIQCRNTSGVERDGPCNPTGPAFLTLTNLNTGAYLVVSYWDRAHEVLEGYCGWNTKLCKGVYTSHGVFKQAYTLSKHLNIPITPISFCQYKTGFDSLALNSNPIKDRDNTGLLFRGWLHKCGFRDELGQLLPNIVVDQDGKLPFNEYYKELQSYKVNLSLDGAAELSHRDIEILGARSVLLRAKLNQVFANPLIDGTHYISFDRASNAKEQSEIILDKYNEIKDNNELLNTISENGYKWFLENGTINKNVEIIVKQLDLDKIL